MLFDEYQAKKNSEFYKGKGPGFRTEFKTFASDARFAQALAVDFHKRMKNAEKEIINVYEFGVGEGSLGTRFLIELRKLGEKLAEKTVYHFCDFSDKIVKNATKRADAFGFNADGIIHDAAKEQPKFLKEADYILANELYDDLPAKLLARDGKKIMELDIEDEGKKLVPFEGEDEIVAYMEKMPERYYIPVNIIAKNQLDFCSKRLSSYGYIDIFDYGFRNIDEIKEIPVELWNNSIIREFGGQVTTDVNFHFISDKKAEPQLEFVEGILGIKLYEVETDRLRYLTGEEMKKEYADFKEERGYLHLRVE